MKKTLATLGAVAVVGAGATALSSKHDVPGCTVRAPDGRSITLLVLPDGGSFSALDECTEEAMALHNLQHGRPRAPRGEKK